MIEYRAPDRGAAVMFKTTRKKYPIFTALISMRSRMGIMIAVSISACPELQLNLFIKLSFVTFNETTSGNPHSYPIRFQRSWAEGLKLSVCPRILFLKIFGYSRRRSIGISQVELVQQAMQIASADA